MRCPNFREEKKLWKKGYKVVIGLDEAGRGALAAPVIAAAVVFKIPNFQFPISNKMSSVKCQMSNVLKEVKDSKKLSSKKREEIFELFKKIPQIEWGIGRVSEKVIDKINILEATKLAMQRAVRNLERKMCGKTKVKPVACERDRVYKQQISDKELRDNFLADFLIIDGNFGIKSSVPQKSIIKADEKVFSCALASIIAKVTRDRAMIRYHKKYPSYGFDKHKGYPTAFHRETLKKRGPCKIHRRSFKPVIGNRK